MFNFQQLQGLCCSQVLHAVELLNMQTSAELIPLQILRHQFPPANFALLLLTFLVFIVENGSWKHHQFDKVSLSSSHSQASSKFCCFFFTSISPFGSVILLIFLEKLFIFCCSSKVTLTYSADAFFMVAAILGLCPCFYYAWSMGCILFAFYFHCLAEGWRAKN